MFILFSPLIDKCCFVTTICNKIRQRSYCTIIYDFWYKLETRISELERDIASYEGIIRNYDKLVAYSTVSVYLREVKELTDTADEYKFGKRIADAFSESWRDFADGFKDFVVGFIEAFPTLLVVAAVNFGIFSAIYFPIRHSIKKKNKDNETKF